MKQTLNVIKWVGLISIVVVILGFSVWILIWKDRQNYKEAINNPPSEYYLEEELEEYLFSTALDVRRTEVYESEVSNCVELLGEVHEVTRDKYYRFRYVLTRKEGMLLPYYKWEFGGYIEICEEELEHDLNS